jgi:hypothetical protein
VKKHIPICILCIVALLCSTAAGETLRLRTIPNEIIQARLGKFAGKNEQRRETLKNMFQEAGCKGQYLNDQPVTGSKLPNLICILPGSSEETIIERRVASALALRGSQHRFPNSYLRVYRLHR